MKKLLVAMVLAGLSTTVYAFGDQSRGQGQRQAQEQGQSQSSSNRNSNSNSNSNRNSNRNSAGAFAGAGALSNAESGGNTYNSTYEATDGRDWAPAVSAPNLTTGICMGSISAGGSGAGFGLSFGSTVSDDECQIRYNSIRLEQLGQKQASTAILCQVPSMKLALQQTGYECPVYKHDDDVGEAPFVLAFPDTAYDSQSVIGGGFYR